MTDDLLSPSALDGLRRRAERGRPRGADAVLAAARSTADGVPERARTTRRRATLAAAAVLVVAAGGGALALAARDGGTIDPAVRSEGPSWCALLARPASPPSAEVVDAAVYLPPEATAADRDGLAAALGADQRITEVRYVDRDATYARFRELFRGEDVLLGNVQADELPTSFDLHLVEGADVEELVDDYQARPEVWAATTSAAAHARLLDLLVWPGHAVGVVASGGNPDLGLRPYPADWAQRFDEVRAAAPEELTGAIDAIGAVLEQAAPMGTPEADAAKRSAEEAVAVLEPAVAERCDLVPDPFFTRSVQQGSSDTTVADDDPPGGTTTTTVPADPGG